MMIMNGGKEHTTLMPSSHSGHNPPSAVRHNHLKSYPSQCAQDLMEDTDDLLMEHVYVRGASSDGMELVDEGCKTQNRRGNTQAFKIRPFREAGN